MRFAQILFAVLLLIALPAFTQPVDAPNAPVFEPAISSAPVTPKAFVLFGETVPLHIQDVFERFDRELLVNSNFKTGNLYILKLAARWLPMIEKILADNGIPDDFKYLCIAESALQNQISRVGATGFWQFMKSTAPGYGLIVNAEIDERYNPEKSTLAATKYLKQAYNRFGNWTAAAASYNCGMGGYASAANLQGTKNYYELYLPSETMAYIFRIMAIKHILENPADFGFVLDKSQLYYPHNVQRIPVKTPIPNLVNFARTQGTDYKTLRILNPWIRSSRISQAYGGKLQLLIPVNPKETEKGITDSIR